MGIPWRVALALQADGWWLRSDIVWHKPCPMPESVCDRPTRAHEHVFLLARSDRYHYDASAISEVASKLSHPRGTGTNPKAKSADVNVKANESFSAAITELVSRRNKRDVWTVAQEPFTAAHYSTFTTKLVEPCILAGCPVDGTVLDPIAGAGTTGLVADRLGRDAILVELNSDYCEMAAQRIRADAPLLPTVSTGVEGPASLARHHRRVGQHCSTW